MKFTEIEQYEYDYGKFVKVCSSNGSRISALCPFHNDKSPSFSCDNETGSWKCHAGCGSGDYGEFFFRYNANKSSTPDFDDDTFNLILKMTAKSKNQDWSGFQCVKTHYYENSDGETIFRVKRFEHPTKSKRFCQEHWSGEKWMKGKYEKGCLMPYLWRHWTKERGDFIFIVEGEKCAESLYSQNLNATAFPMGVNGWQNNYGHLFADWRVVILPDNDEPGLAFGKRVENALSKLNIPVRTILLHGLAPAEDIVDWTQNGNSYADLVKLADQAFS